MAFTTYADLQTSVSTWLHRSDLASIIPDLIALGEDRIYRSLRVRDMEEEIDSTIESDGTFPLPSDYVDMKNLWIDTSTVHWLERKTEEWIIRNDPSRSSGIPRYFARHRNDSSSLVLNVLIFAPFPASQYALKGTYYRRLEPLSDAVNTTYLAHPGLWLFSALAESAPFLKNDPRIAVWEAKFAQVVVECNAEEKRENSSGSNLAMTVE